MICFRDMTFCSASCRTLECPRQFTDEDRRAAEQWMKDAPVAWQDFSAGCPDYKPREA